MKSFSNFKWTFRSDARNHCKACIFHQIHARPSIVMQKQEDKLITPVALKKCQFRKWSIKMLHGTIVNNLIFENDWIVCAFKFDDIFLIVFKIHCQSICLTRNNFSFFFYFFSSSSSFEQNPIHHSSIHHYFDKYINLIRSTYDNNTQFK